MIDLMHTPDLLGWVNCTDRDILMEHSELIGFGYDLRDTLGTGPCSAVGNVSGYRCVSDCRSRGREFDPGPVPYFRGD